MIADFVQATASIPLYQIPAHVASFPKLWPFPRGDTYHWIPVLNRFDRILERFNQEYGLVDGPQTQPFERRLLLKGDAEEGSTPEPATADILDELNIPQEGDRVLIEQILNFTRLLLENCGNRSLYSSSAHLDKLLNTTSVSLLKATLRLTLRLAQRYHAARMRLAPATLHPTLLASHYNINLDKVQKLAGPFPKGSSTAAPLFATPAGKGKDKVSGERRSDTERVNAADMVGLFTLPESSLQQEFGGVSISYYESSAAPEDSANKPTATEGPATPTPVRRTSNVRTHQTPRQPHESTSADSPITPAFTPGDGGGGRPSGPKTFELPAETVSKGDFHGLLKQGLAELPESAHYELLHKLRTAQTVSLGRTGREHVVSIRMLAVANLAYVHSEKEFHARLGQQDADEPRRLQWAYQLSELVHPPGTGGEAVSTELQTFALNALEALAKHKAKSADICTALSVNVNHGVLFYIVRKMVAELGVDDSQDNLEEDEWREALFSLLNTLPTSQARTGEGMVAAGLLEILVDVLKLRTNKAERNHPKILNFLDTFVYNLRDAFQALVDAKGLDIIADLVFYEVTTSEELAKEGQGMPKEYKTQLTDYQIPFYHQQTLRWLFKFMNHMMSHTGGGNFDRQMRNLIDSANLQRGLKTVLSTASVFGSTVWSMAVNILTTFIHNEPTSYSVINDAGLSTALLESVSGEKLSESPTMAPSEDLDSSDQGSSLPQPSRVYPPRDPSRPLASGILPVAEAISTVPPAFGAICLAEAGMKLFQSSTALKRFFEIFESPVHVKALDMDPEIPTIIGNAFDELVRHHPPLKGPVLSSLSEMVGRVVQLCFDKAAKDGAGAKLWTGAGDGKIFVAGGRQALAGPEGFVHKELWHRTATDGDVEMQDTDGHSASSSTDDAVTLEQVIENEDSTSGPTTSQYISVVCRFLGGFFTNHAMCGAYIEADGVESILDFATLPCLDARFNESRTTSEEFARVVQVLVEQKPHITVPSMLKRTQQALDHLEPLMRHTGKQAFFAPFTNPSGIQASSEEEQTLARGTEYVKALVAVHTLVNALTMTFQGQMFNTRSTHNVSSQVNLADMYARLVDSLGRLHRSCVWEEILLQKNMPPEWEKETRIKSSGFGAIEADNVFHLGNSDRPSESTGASNSEGTTAGATAPSDNAVAPSQHSARFKNTQILRYLLSKIPTGIAPFFQSLGKLLLFRRSLEPYQKQCAIIVADQLAQAAIDQLQFEGPKASESAEDRYAYWIVILTSLSQLMIDNNMDRVSPQALTLILVSFRNLGGLTVLAEILSTFFESAMSIVRTQGDDAGEDSQRLLNLSLGGVKIILAFYVQIINAKVINEASQTTSMQSRPDRERERPDFFLPAQFIVELRYAVTKPVQKIWDSDLIDKATTSIVKTSINILKTVLDGDGEHGAYKSVDKIPKRNKPIIKPWKPRNEDHMQRLKEAGHSEGLAEEALFRCCDNFNTAREYCQNQTRDIRASRNPIPQYEINARGPPTASPSRAEVIVPEPTDNASISSDDEGEDSEAPDSQSVEMEDADTSQPHDPAPTTPVPETQSATDPPVSSQDGLAYQKRMATGNVAEPVAIDDLDKERATIRENLVDRSLDILNSHDDVTFELADLISAAVAKAPDPSAMRGEIGSTLVQSLISLQTGDDFRAQGKKIAASAHLLGLIIQDKDFYEAVVDELKENFLMLLEFIKVFPDQPAEESSAWVGHVLVIAERLLAEDQLPRQIQWTPPTVDAQDETPVEQLPEPIVSLDEKNHLFDALLEILPRIGKDESLALSVTRVLVMLTRTRKIALRLAERRNIQRLFLMVKQLAGITNESLRSAFMIVLRHIIEDDAMIRQIMRSEIQSMFESRDRRQTDTTGYARQMYYLAIRAPEIFVEVTNEKLQLARFDPNQRPQTLVLKKDESPAAESDLPGPSGTSGNTPESDRPKETSEPVEQPVLERTKTSDLKPPVVENPDGVIHYLLCELLAYKEIDDKPEPPKTTEKADQTTQDQLSAPGSASVPSSTNAEQQKTEKLEFKADAHPIYIYRCFILKCLAELLQSYNRTKIEFINFSRKADPYATTPSKPRSGVLNYLLNNLVPVGSLNHEGDLSFKKKLATSSCAIDVIVSLCAKTGEQGAPKQGLNPLSPYVETEPDLLFVRKFVLEHALKAFRDASASDEALEMKYSRLLGIADIFSKMVSQRPNGEMLNQNSDLTPTLKQMAKIMYEKNFITILTTAIADIDLNFPNTKRVVKYILKPLKWLCYVAMDLSTRYDTSSTPDSTDEYEISSASDDDLVGATREETPDLFRNSTLGMFEPRNGSDSEPSDDEEDEEMYDEAFADDMEYDEEIGDNDEVISEDEEMEMELGDMGPIEGLPGDVDVEIELDEDDEDLGSEDDSQEDDEDDGEEDEDEDEGDDDEGDDEDEDMEELGDLEEITGDDENASLADDREDSWSGDDGHFPGDGDPNMPPGALGFVLDPPQLLEQIREDRLDDFMDDDMQEDEGRFSRHHSPNCD